MSDGGGAKRPRKEEDAEGDAMADASSESSSSDDPQIRDAIRDSANKAAAREQIPFSFEDLEAQVENLRAERPAYVSDIGRLTRPQKICGDGGEIVLAAESGEEGPWDLSLRVAGLEGDQAYGTPQRINLRFDVDLWPMKLALVRFRGVFHHALTDDEGGMLMPFYRNLPKDERGACTVRLVVEAIHLFLVDPLIAWKIPKAKAPISFTKGIGVNRELQVDRKSTIDKYAEKALHKELLREPVVFEDEWLDPAFLNAVRVNTPETWRGILEEHLPGEVFSFRIFTDAFCDKFVDEIHNFYASGLPVRRPNSMNNYGVVINDIGLEPWVFKLQEMLQPLGAVLFPGPGDVWDGQHCFIVRYRAGEDLGLDMHTDDSDVTVNVCLGAEFTAAHLQFCGVMGAPNHRKHTYSYEHKKGRCVIHLGRKRHGADDIESGERFGLILWNHSSTWRSSDAYTKPGYKTEESAPDKICVSYTHDRDYGIFKEYPIGKEKFKGRGWCPRPTHEYLGFKPDADKEREDEKE